MGFISTTIFVYIVPAHFWKTKKNMKLECDLTCGQEQVPLGAGSAGVESERCDWQMFCDRLFILQSVYTASV